MKNKILWRGLATVMAVLVVIMSVGISLGLKYENIVNDALNVSTTKVIEGSQGEIYFKSEFGDFNEESQNKLIEATELQVVSEMEEGAVLLRNERDALPLAEDERRVTLFGRASVDPVYKNHSSGNSPGAQNEAYSLIEALTDRGFSVNQKLADAYTASTVKRDLNTGDIGEVSVDFYTDELKATWESDYNDVAFVVFTRESSEGCDFFTNDIDGVSQLSFHEKERQLIEMIKSSGKFKKIVVLLNTPTPIDLGWLEEYDIDACLWMGTPGTIGFIGVVNILTGKVSPSGRLVDTYAADSLSSPAIINSSTNSTLYTNADEISKQMKDRKDNTSWIAVHPEGIYVGYKYYETRYEDSVLGLGGATAAIGASNGASEWNYSNEVIYPFGYGLSYTSFEQTLDSVKDNGDGTMTVNVTVKNVGKVAGKSVVELYVQTPYGDYEKENLVEKSAIQLVEFGKTKLLQPNESETITLTAKKYLFASYDYTNAKTYILSEGDYYFSIGDNAHDALNNVLAAKGASGMVDVEGNSASGDAKKTYKWHEEFDKETYSKSVTGYEVTNQFDDCDLNYWIEGAVTYISRQDWKGTYPTGQYNIEATPEMIKLLSGDFYEKPADAPAANTIVQGENKGITLLDMRGLSYDDPKWEEYLSQMTIDELLSQLPEGAGTQSVVSVNKPDTSAGDGIDGLNGKLPYGDKPYCQTYCAKVVLSSTWNKDLMRRRGELMGEEALFRSMVAIWTVGGDLHLTPFGGRNFEYISEDGVFNYLAAIPETQGCQSKGVSSAVKHFAGNDQEFHREGVNMFFNEQFFREIDLRTFEGGVCEGGSKALMQSLSRLGLIYDPASYALNTTVLREEWGFEGIDQTDGTAGSTHKQHFEEILSAGTSVFCLDTGNLSVKQIKKVIMENNDGYMLNCLRRAVKDYHYVLVNSCGVNNLSPDTQIVYVTPWWQIAAYCALALFAIVFVGSFAMFIITKYDLKRKKKGE